MAQEQAHSMYSTAWPFWSPQISLPPWYPATQSPQHFLGICGREQTYHPSQKKCNWIRPACPYSQSESVLVSNWLWLVAVSFLLPSYLHLYHPLVSFSSFFKTSTSILSSSVSSVAPLCSSRALALAFAVVLNTAVTALSGCFSLPCSLFSRAGALRKSSRTVWASDSHVPIQTCRRRGL